MDITSEFRKLAHGQTSKREAQLGKDEKDSRRFDILPPKRCDFTHPANNAYLTEAYIIARHLEALRVRILDTRPAYLNLQTKQSRQTRAAVTANSSGSTRHRYGMAKLSEPERDEIDRSIKTAIRQMLAKIRSLSELGEVMLEDIGEDNGMESAKLLLRRFVNALDPRQAGGQGMQSGDIVHTISRRDVIAAHQSSVVWWLNSKLQKTNKAHAEMQELYLRQKLERQRGAIAQQQHSPTSTRAKGALSPAAPEKQVDDDKMLSHLSEQELLQLQAENSSMMQEFESALGRIKETQRSLLEISTLQSQLANELSAQTQQTERLYNEAVGAADAVGQGNDYLVSARKNQATARKWVLTIFIVLSLVLLFLDWFD
ncbi:hypothetical protein GQ54DRAFT_89708 [Martensiomyces pterosporus]|nr:hypothetical protein GQ54DRAFT_89708 [Martensiomyces pterosporus]